MVIFLVLTIAAVLVRLPGLNESLWYDEVWYTSVMLDSSSLSRVLFHDVHPPLYPLLMKGWIMCFGDSEISVRLPSLLFGLGSLGLAFIFSRTLFGTPVALLATLLTTLSPVHIWYSQEAKNNMLLLFLTLLSAYGFQRAFSHGATKDWLLFTVSSVLALWTNHFSIFVVFSLFVILWAIHFTRSSSVSQKWSILSTVLVVAAGLLVLLPVLLKTETLSRDYLRPFSLGEFYKLFFVYLSHGNTLRTFSPYSPIQMLMSQPWTLFLIDGFYVILTLGGLYALGRHIFMDCVRRHSGSIIKSPQAFLLTYILLPPILLSAASILHPEIYIERSMIVVLPPFMILLAYTVLKVLPVRLMPLLICCLLTLNGVSLYNLHTGKADTWTVYKPNPDWRTFAGDVKNRFGESVIFTSCWPLAIQYYLGDHAFLAVPWQMMTDADERNVNIFIREAFFRRRIRDARFFYVAINRHWDAFNLQEINRETIGRMYRLIDTRHYGGLDVFRYGL